ncbi:MAG TPA: ROK family transcriptional regulator [Anaerolineaceae bacterium]|nr:ROK family transcriptional regulator [Anaerolineaceae bacterium]
MSSLPPKATHQQTKTYNQQLVFKAIYDQGEISRADLARLTGLTRVTVSEIVAELIEKSLVAEVGFGPSAGGKNPILLGVVADAYHLIGVDLASDEFRGAVVNLRGEIRHTRSVPLPANDGAESLQQVYALIDDLVAQTEAPLLGIGIGTPGLLDTEHGVVRRAVNLGWQDLPLGSLLQARYNLPVYIGNDSHVTALAEQIFGAGLGAANLAVLRVGRGIGAGVILNGQLYQGESFGAGEIGHISIDPHGARCRCGNTGCLETIGSARAIVQRARQFAQAEPGSQLHRQPEDAPLTLGEVLSAFTAGDEVARRVVTDSARAVGFAAAILASTLNIRRILLVGSVTRFGQPWLDGVRAELQSRTLPALSQQTEITLGETAANGVILGASALLLTCELGLNLAR